MKKFLKKNFAIISAFVLPITLIAVVALSAYLPSLFLSTNYNFLYSSCTDGTDYFPYSCNNYLQKRYSVVNGKIVVNPIDPAQDSDQDGIPDINENYTARIFLYDTKKNESREITLEEAQALSLSGLLTSPDGLTISRNYNNGSSLYDYCLIKGKSRIKLNLVNNGDRYYYQGNFQFIGWVLPGRN